jgi:thioesterase domain-containing protein
MLASMANDYADVICQHSPNGPYHLLGWSSGGILALAIAEAMEKKGVQVGSVSLVDTYLLVEDESTVELDSVQNLILTFCNTIEEKYPEFAAWTYVIDQMNALYDEILPLSSEERVERLLDWLGGMNFARGEFRDVLRQQLNLYNSHYSVLKAYKPSEIHAPLFVIWAGETLPRTNEFPVDWDKYTSGGVRTEVVNGNHYSIMRPPAVQTLAERLAARLEKSR